MAKKPITILSWNVNGIRAVEKKGFLKWLEQANPDILCLQETKAHIEQLSEAILHPNGYEAIWSSGKRKGYSGTVVYTKLKPKMSMTNFEQDWLHEEGRTIMVDYGDFILFNIYFPNGGRGPERLKYKLDFYDRFLDYIEGYRKKGHNIIVTGDLNTAHHEIDLARPKENVKNSGFMPIERERLDTMEKLGYVDTYRLHNPQTVGYSYWDQKSGARARNVGWRIDYFWVNKEFLPHVKQAFILPDVMGSDHCPVGIKVLAS
jgi:exodeoxyribonuclease-3